MRMVRSVHHDVPAPSSGRLTLRAARIVMAARRARAPVAAKPRAAWRHLAGAGIAMALLMASGGMAWAQAVPGPSGRPAAPPLRTAPPVPAPLVPAPLVPTPLARPPVAEPLLSPVVPRAAFSVSIPAGSGRLLQLPRAAASVIAAEPRIARVEPTSPTSLFVMAVAAGRTTVVATAEDGTAVAEYEVTVTPGAFEPSGNREPLPSAAVVERAIRGALRGAGAVTVTAAGRNGFVLSGTVATASDAQRAETIARVFAGDERTVINNLQLLSAIQVNVRVRIAEVSRQITRDLGFNWRAFGQTGNWLVGLRTGPSALSVVGAVLGAGSSLATSPSRLALGYQTGSFDINAVVDALAADQLISILAEPNLTAQSGETASFLAGGEFPIPIAAGNNGQITIEFKQYGVSLAFVPTVLSPERVNLRVRPEVSELTEQGAVTIPLAGTGATVTIPALAVRRAETTVELGSGQSFAIAGLLQRNSRQNDSGILGIGEIPVLGALFRSDRFQRNETELVIIVTPYLVRPVSDPGVLAAPTDGFRPATDIDRILFQRQLARGSNAPQLQSRPDAGFILE